MIRSILRLLVDKDYATLQKLSGGKRLTASEMELAISQYGRTLIMPPEDKLLQDVISISTSSIPSWSVVVPLYTLEEGLSDLSLELTITSHTGETFDVEIDDLHVR